VSHSSPTDAPVSDRPIVCKFGGTSLAGADQMRKVAAIVAADPRRRVVVPSAPGKRTPDDQRFRGLVAELNLSLDLEPLLTQARDGIAAAAKAGQGPDFAASRGEALNGQVIAALLGCHPRRPHRRARRRGPRGGPRLLWQRPFGADPHV